MKKYMKIVVCTIILIAVIVVVGLDLLKDKLYIPQDNLWNESTSDSAEGSEETEEIVMTEEDKTYSMHEEVKIENEVYIDNNWSKQPLMFVVHGYEVTKECPGELPVLHRLAEHFDMDSEGTFTSNYSYFLVYLTIINNTDYDQVWWLNEFLLDLKDNQENIMGKSEVFIYNNKEKCNDKDYFSYTHPAHSQQDFTIGFFMTDEELSDAATIKLEITHWGSGGEKPHNFERYVTLKSKE
ncbi:MAG: hypothetical protein IJ439_01690 [Tyzzerella sp.]|nr:hypothetical protein [Tyzzerella sp.]